MSDQGSASQESPLVSKLGMLNKRITELTEELGRLDGRLMPLCLPVPPIPSNEAKLARPEASNILRTVLDCTSALEGLIVGVKQLQSRLQV